MQFSIKFDTAMSGWSIVYVESQRLYFQIYYISFYESKIDFVLANSADPYEMPRYAVFHFIWVFIVCQSTRLGVSGLQMVYASIYSEQSINCLWDRGHFGVFTIRTH